MPDQGPVVVIGLKEIYDQLVSLNTKVEVVMGDVADVQKRDDDHETRLRALERARWPLPSLAALISIAALVVAIISKL